MTKNPYDAELLSLGDEPAGPSMRKFRSEFESPEARSGQLVSVVARLTYAVQLLQWVVPWDISVGDFFNLLAATTLGVFLTGSEVRRWRAGRDGSRYLRSSSSDSLAVGFGVVSLGVGGYLLAAPDVERFRWIWQNIGLLTLGAGTLSILEGRFGRSRGERTGFAERWAPSATAVLFAFGAVGLVTVTGWLGFGLEAATAFGLAALRRVPSSDLRSRPRVVRADAVVGYVGRLFAVLPAILLILFSTGKNYENVYLGLSVLLVCSAGVPHGRTMLDSPREGFDPRSYLVAGFRTVLAGGALLTAVGLTYVSLGPTSLSVAYVGLALLLLRVAGALLSTTFGVDEGERVNADEMEFDAAPTK